MSLINDMLRDLDQRRKDTPRGLAATELTPASEVISDSKSQLPLYLAGALALIAGALGVAWYVLVNEDRQQPLDIRPEVTPPVADMENPEPRIQPAEVPREVSEPQPAVVGQPTPGEITRPAGAAAGLAVAQAAPAQAGNRGGDGRVAPTSGPDTVQGGNEAPLTPSRVASPNPQPGAGDRAADDEPVADVTVPVGEQRSVAAAEAVKNPAESTPEQRDTAAVQEALTLIAGNRMSDAYRVLEGQISANRYGLQSRETYAKLLLSQGDIPQANRIIEAGLQLAPNHSGFKKVKARLLLAGNDVNGAVALLLSRAPEVAADPEYHELLASAQIAGRDYRGASLSYTSLLQYDPGQGKWWYGFAAAQDRLGNTGAARQAYRRAMQQPSLSASLRRRSQERLNQLGP